MSATSYSKMKILLSDIADGLKEVNHRYPLGAIEVDFICGEETYTFSLMYALESLAKDLYWDERGNWSQATKAVVREI